MKNTFERFLPMSKLKIQILALMLITVLFAGNVLAKNAYNGEIRDFGMLLNGGGVSGINNQIKSEMGIYADFYFLSETFRMIFGASFVHSAQEYFPLTTIQSIGVEYNIPLARNFLIMGATYNKSYLLEKRNGLGGKKGSAFYAGFKLFLAEDQDLVFKFGTKMQPFARSNNDPDYPLEDKVFFFNIGSEWYF